MENVPGQAHYKFSLALWNLILLVIFLIDYQHTWTMGLHRMAEKFLPKEEDGNHIYHHTRYIVCVIIPYQQFRIFTLK